MEDGIYLELFVTKNGIKYPIKSISLKYFVTFLTNKFMDGIEELFNVQVK